MSSVFMTFLKTMYAAHKTRSSHSISTRTKYPFMSQFSTVMPVSKLMERKVLRITLPSLKGTCLSYQMTTRKITTSFTMYSLILRYLREQQHLTVDKIHEFTDGCAGQYKSKHTFGDLSCCLADFGCQIDRHFF